jgi:hypothetical protein
MDSAGKEIAIKGRRSRRGASNRLQKLHALTVAAEAIETKKAVA